MHGTLVTYFSLLISLLLSVLACTSCSVGTFSALVHRCAVNVCRLLLISDYDEDNEYYDEEIYISVETSADNRGPSSPLADNSKKSSASSGDNRQLPHNPCGPSYSDPLLRGCPDDPKSTRATFNLLYVLVPVSGACALLALCATAFVLLKRGEPPQSQRGSNPSDVYDYVDGGRRHVLETDKLQMDLEKEGIVCHRQYNIWSVTNERKNRKDPLRTGTPSRTYIDSRIFAA